jgi:hypothetical protein
MTYLYPPYADVALYTLIGNASIVSLNLSLMLNTVTFYQVGSCQTFTQHMCAL